MKFVDGLNCFEKFKHSESCVSDTWCRSDLGLSCVTGKCLCNSSVEFWNGISCIDYRSHNETCSSQTECRGSQETMCLNGICACNSTSHYFNASADRCFLQLNERVSCKFDYECLGNMTCSTGLCLCPNIITHFFNSTSLLCTPKTLENTVCSSSVTCRTDLGLSCIVGVCQCDASMIWNGSLCISSCPSGWTLYSSYCYYESITPRIRGTWNESYYNCLQIGGIMVNFESLNEFKIFQSIFGGKEIHVGLEKKQDNKWYWSDGSLFYDPLDSTTYDSAIWNSGEPRNSGACGYYNNGKLHSNDCGTYNFFVCEL